VLGVSPKEATDKAFALLRKGVRSSSSRDHVHWHAPA
jgi:hypothetical protein